MNFIPESDVYRLIIKPRLKEQPSIRYKHSREETIHNEYHYYQASQH